MSSSRRRLKGDTISLYRGHRLDSFGLGCGLVTDSCKDGNEPLFSLQYEEFIGWLGYCKHYNETSAPLYYHLCIKTPHVLVFVGNFAGCFLLRLTSFREHEYVNYILSFG